MATKAIFAGGGLRRHCHRRRDGCGERTALLLFVLFLTILILTVVDDNPCDCSGVACPWHVWLSGRSVRRRLCPRPHSGRGDICLTSFNTIQPPFLRADALRSTSGKTRSLGPGDHQRIMTTKNELEQLQKEQRNGVCCEWSSEGRGISASWVVCGRVLLSAFVPVCWCSGGIFGPLGAKYGPSEAGIRFSGPSLV